MATRHIKGSTRARREGDLNLWKPTEWQFEEWVIATARQNGWKCFFFPDWAFRLAMASLKRTRRTKGAWPNTGWPDLVMMRKGKLIIAELKIGNHGTKQATPRDEQIEWLETLASYGVPVYLWLPSDRDWIEKVLT